MCASRAFRLLFLTLLPLVASVHRAHAQPERTVVQPSDLRRRIGAYPFPAQATRVGSSGGIDTVSATRPVVLRPGELLVVKGGDTASASPPVARDTVSTTGPDVNPPAPGPVLLGTAADSLLDTAVVKLPYGLALNDSRVASGVRYLEVRVEIVGGGFRYNHRERAYEGKILIGILDRDRPGQRVVLSDIYLQITGEVDAATPGTFPLLSTSVPFQEVALRAEMPRRDTVMLRVIPSFDPAGITVPVPVRPAGVVVRVSPRHIAGLGLEKADVLIEPPYAAGSVPLTVTALLGRPAPNQLDVGPATAVAHVRSRGIGSDTVSVLGGAYSGVAVVHYDPPWLIAIAMVLGGILGGLLGGFARKRPGDQPPDRRTLLAFAIQGLLTGIGVTVLYTIGIKAFAWAPDGEFGEAIVFIVSFMGGLAGPRVFDRFLPPAPAGQGGDSRAPAAGA